MPTRPCRGPISRRALLRLGALGLGGLHRPRFAQAQAAPGSPSTAVILFWMWGGPSQLETFDPKPDAPAKYRGPFRPVRTAVPGMDVCELFPLLARQARRLALVRSLHHTMSSHNDGSIEVLTGKTPAVADPTSTARSDHPDLGMIASRVRGPRPDGLPQYVGVPTPPFMTRPVYLGLQHQGFAASGGGRSRSSPAGSRSRSCPDAARRPVRSLGTVDGVRNDEKTMSDRTISVDGVRVPRFLYGTAWKEDRTQGLTELALRQGFRGIDTANQRKHYHEAAVGQAVAAAVAAGLVARVDLFLQTKFTFRGGQDHRLPYDPKAPVGTQVEQSFARSLEHLGTDVIDCYLLHGPSRRSGLGTDDWEAWRAMEALHQSGQARLLGVSNVTLEQLRLLCDRARVPPRCVQNRCYAAQGWDLHAREFCAANGLIYQGFSLLTANRQALARPELAAIARRHGRTVCQVVFRFALDAGMVPLTGTTDAGHMREDLDVFDFRLGPDEVERIERLEMA